jgi:phage shock protein C
MNSNTEDAQYPGEPGAGREAGSQTRPQLRRPHKGRMIAGVCVAISRHFNVDVTIVRVTFAVLAIIGFTGLAYLGSLPLYLGGIPLYLACWVLIPEEGAEHSIAAAFVRSLQSRSRSS